MKKAGVVLLLILLLTGCEKENRDLDRGIALRTKILQSKGCSFDCQITADYSDKLYQFEVACQADTQGDLTFEVKEPQTISGITGNVSGTGGNLTFADTVLHIGLLADDQLSPVSAPWIFMKTLRSGCITSAGMDGELLRLSIDDSYEEDALRLDVWLDEEDLPLRCEILHDGRKILSLDVRNFQYV